MRKFKVAVNRNLGFVAVLYFGAIAVSAKNPSYTLAEYNAGNFRVVLEQNTNNEAPVGSLLKPFAAWYLLENGVDQYQTVFCPPERRRSETLRCWTPQGHGATHLAAALVQSCNYYFLSMFYGKNLSEYQHWLVTRFDWPASLPISKPANVYGFDLQNGIEPAKLLGMYTTLLAAAESRNANAMVIRDALSGTCQGTLTDACKRLQKLSRFRFLLGKTGTVQTGGKPYGITFLLLEYLPEKRKILLLCYEKDKTGSQAALNAPNALARYDSEIRKRKSFSR